MWPVALNRTQIKILGAGIALVVIVWLAFLPALQNGFTNWDDPAYVTGNPAIKELSWSSVTRIFTTAHQGLYKPLVLFSFAIEYHFFGLNPWIYHATNGVLHCINSLLVFWLIFLFSRRLGIAWLVAVLFGIHPLHVESVAWVTERKDMLSGLFFLAGSVAYLASGKGRRRITCLYFV